MTREKMLKISWKGYMEIELKTSHMPIAVPCMCLSVDFENNVLTLLPFDNEIIEEEILHVSIDYCELPKPKPRLIK